MIAVYLVFTSGGEEVEGVYGSKEKAEKRVMELIDEHISRGSTRTKDELRILYFVREETMQ